MKSKKYEYIGNLSQLFRIENYRLEGGRKDGMRATQVANESGLNYTVLADRCMDIGYLSFKGVNISYINPCGLVKPEYYDRTGTNWLRSFGAGFLTTCGLDNVGNPCVDGEEHGLHGRIGNTPADEYCVNLIKKESDNEVRISGVMNDGAIFGDKLQLKRTIISYQEKSRIVIEDEIVNNGFKEAEYMQLYHCNIGYPFLSPDCEMILPSRETRGANLYSEEHIDTWARIEAPADREEMCYFHKLETEDGKARVGMVNKMLGIGFTITYGTESLDKFIQWKYLNKGEYVMGLEPATDYTRGKAEVRKKDVIKRVMARGAVKHRLVIDFFDEG